MPITNRARIAAAATSCLLAAGLAAAAPATAATHHRGTTYLHTTHRHTVLAPASIRPGVARVHNSGNDPVIVFGKRSAAGPYQLVHDIGSTASSAKKLFKDFILRDEVGAHQTVYLPLQHGTLYVVDVRRMHYGAGAVRTIRVTGHAINAAVPSSRPVVIAADNSLHAARTVGYHGTLHVMNHSSGLQQVLIARISAGAPASKVSDFAAHPTIEKLFALHIASLAPVATLAGHHGLWTTLSGPRGRYGLIVLPLAGRHTPKVQLLAVG